MTLSTDSPMQTQTVPATAPVAPSYLKQLADSLKRRARQHPDHPMFPEPPLKNKAMLIVIWHSRHEMYQLRIARGGLSPLHLWSTKGSKQLRAWRNECKTFLRDFGVPAPVFPAEPENAPAPPLPEDARPVLSVVYDGAEQLIYYVDCYFKEPSHV